MGTRSQQGWSSLGDMPIAMKPDHQYDKTGVFSGSAIEKDGKLYVLYTGHVDEDGQITETQCVAVSDDGVDFNKYENNPVMTVADLPGETDESNFRDPKSLSTVINTIV